MKRRTIELAGVLYVSFALLAAHTSLAPPQTALAERAHQAPVVAIADGVVLDNQRLHRADSETDRAEDTERRTNKSAYTVTIWTAGWCSKCPAYKARVQPALLKLGYTVVVKDWDKNSDERPQLRAVPAVCIHYKGEMIYLKVVATVAEIDAFVEKHMPDTPDGPEDDPGDLY
jgi:hypothetical protein